MYFFSLVFQSKMAYNGGQYGSVGVPKSKKDDLSSSDSADNVGKKRKIKRKKVPFDLENFPEWFIVERANKEPFQATKITRKYQKRGKYYYEWTKDINLFSQNKHSEGFKMVPEVQQKTLKQKIEKGKIPKLEKADDSLRQMVELKLLKKMAKQEKAQRKKNSQSADQQKQIPDQQKQIPDQQKQVFNPDGVARVSPENNLFDNEYDAQESIPFYHNGGHRMHDAYYSHQQFISDRGYSHPQIDYPSNDVAMDSVTVIATLLSFLLIAVCCCIIALLSGAGIGYVAHNWFCGKRRSTSASKYAVGVLQNKEDKEEIV